jgi:hypothetical protein
MDNVQKHKNYILHIDQKIVYSINECIKVTFYKS